jgi:hypothetical protein
MVPDGNTIAAPGLNPYVTFGSGAGILAAGAAIAILFPTPSPFQLAVFSVLVASGATLAFSVGVVGRMVIRTRWITAGGPIAVFIVVCFFVVKVAGSNALDGLTQAPAASAEKPAR